ncbi:MAG: sulfatase [Candidatus Lernaella stagnicola]|nr:sulfatase [Candidatus Lernaella stagnicola]
MLRDIGRRAAIILAILAALTVTGGCTPNKPPELRNVVFVSLDTVRADHLSCYGYQRATSPHIDALAAEGMLFENAMAQSSWTTPSHASLFTGLLSSAHGAAQLNQPIKKEVPVLAEYLQDAGFQTGGFVTHLFVGDYLGFDRGFDSFWYEQTPRAKGPVDAALTWLEGRNEKPFFLFLHLFDPHHPYAPPDKYVRQYEGDCRREPGNMASLGKLFDRDATGRDQLLACLIRRYDDEIHYADEQLGRLFAYLKEKALWDQTLVVFLSDHGEEFLDHGSVLHAITLYQEQLHVPLILAGGPPGLLQAGSRVKGRVALYDIMPTLLDLFDIKPKATMTAQTLLPHLRGKTQPDRDVIAETNDVGPDRMTLLSGPAKYLYAPDAHVFQQHMSAEFYDLAGDPGEKHNLLDERPQEAARVRARMIEQGRYATRQAWRIMWGGAGSERAVRGRLQTEGRFTHAFKYLGFTRFDEIPEDLPIDQALRQADYQIHRASRVISFSAADHIVANGFAAVLAQADAPLTLTVDWRTETGDGKRETLTIAGTPTRDKPLLAAGGLVRIFTEDILTFPEAPPELEISRKEKLPAPLKQKLRTLGYF